MMRLHTLQIFFVFAISSCFPYGFYGSPSCSIMALTCLGVNSLLVVL